MAKFLIFQTNIKIERLAPEQAVQEAEPLEEAEKKQAEAAGPRRSEGSKSFGERIKDRGSNN